jgi:Mrr N-terminal domain
MAAKKVHTQRGQFMLVVMAALDDITDRTPSKREVIRQIEKKGYLKLTPELLAAYRDSGEPVWHNLVAWAREDLAELGYIERGRRDAWPATGKVGERLARLRDELQKPEYQQGLDICLTHSSRGWG